MSLRSRLGFNDAVYLVDGSSFIFRAFYAYQSMTRSDGFPTNILFIVTRLLLKVLREERPAFFAFIMDGKGKNYRNDIFPTYKANRSATPESLILQLEPLQNIVRNLGIMCLVSDGCEADDCIASLTARFSPESPIVIMGSDKDLKQCLTPNVVLWDPSLKNEKIVTLQSFQEETGMLPSSWPDYQALVGDSSDNIPGIAQVGPKTAQALIHDFPTLEELFSRLPAVPPKVRAKLEGQEQNALLYRKLTRLGKDACPSVQLEQLAVNDASLASVLALLEEYELQSLAREVESMIRAGIWERAVARGESALGSVASAQSKNTQAFPLLAQPPVGIKDLEVPRVSDNESGDSEALISKRGSDAMTQAPLFLVPAGPDFSSFSVATDAMLLGVQVGGMVSLLSFPQGLLVATGGRENMYTGDMPSLVQCLAAQKAMVVGADVKSLCAVIPALWGLSGDRWYDLSLAAYLLSPEDRNYGWEHIVQRFSDQMDSAHAAHEHPGLFALDMYRFVTERLAGAGLSVVLETLELPLIPVLAQMEHRGITIDKSAFSSFLHDVQTELDALTEQIYGLAEGAFNIRSAQQLSDVLFVRLGLPKAGKTKGGAMSTSQASLEKLLGKHPIIDAILTYRKLEKLRSTYLEPLPQEADAKDRLHTTFNQMATATGRLSSSNPNLQNIPVRGPMGKRMRACFVAAPGKVLVCADYSQIELRVLAHLSQDPTLLEAFLHNEDIHSRTAALLYEVASDQVTPDQRSNAKTINFGLVYGMGPQKLGQELGISVREAKEFIERYFERLSRLKQFYDAIENDARNYGYVTTMGGRRRLTPDILSQNNQMRSQARRQAINTRIQGSAADIIKIAMIAVENDSELRTLGASLLLQIHDELLLEVAPENAQRVAERLAMLMRSVRPGGETLEVPLLVDWGIGKSWADAH